MTGSERFAARAIELITKKGLLINGKMYEFAELEFYEHSSEHPDPTVHCHPDQLTNECWYFHRTSKKSDAKYRGGTFKGLDMTFGAAPDRYYGVLIRAIFSPETGMISGPCNTVNHILKSYGVASIEELVGVMMGSSFQQPLSNTVNHRGLVVVDRTNDHYSLAEQIYCGPRIGLKETPPYSARHYRYVRHIKLAQKDKRSLVPL